MAESSIYSDIAARTDGAFLLGVVGPVRTGKSSFIKRFMETLVIPHIENTYMRERARDELPQSGSGRTIMTAEPKFVPENAVSIRLGEQTELSVRLVDCVGYMVEGAAGQEEDGSERMVTTPWFDHEVTLTEAAEKGTYKVITEHSTVGIVVTTDGSICELPRRSYEEPERRVIQELQSIGKPFVVLLNCTDPDTPDAKALAAEIAERYGVRCLPVNCLTMSEADIAEIRKGKDSAMENLEERISILQSAFAGAGLPLVQLTPPEALNVIWRTMHPFSSNDPEVTASDIAKNMVLGEEIYKKNPPELEEWTSDMKPEEISSMLSPNYVIERKDMLEIDGVLMKGYVVYDFRPNRPTHMYRLNSLSGSWLGTLFVEVMDPAVAADKLSQRETQLSAQEMVKAKQGMLVDFGVRQEVSAVQESRMQLETAGQAPINIRFFVLRTALNKEGTGESLP